MQSSDHRRNSWLNKRSHSLKAVCACNTSHDDLPRQRRLNPTPPPHQPCRIRILHITAGAQERTILALHLPRSSRHLPYTVISLQHIHHGSHQGRLLAPGANTALCPLLLLRRHYPRYALACHVTQSHIAKTYTRHLLILPRGTSRPRPGHPKMAKGC